MAPERCDTWYLSFCFNILNIPDIPNIPVIPTITEMSIIIQTSSRLSFQKGMTLDVCHDIPDILNIPVIPDIPTIPKIPIFI